MSLVYSEVSMRPIDEPIQRASSSPLLPSGSSPTSSTSRSSSSARDTYKRWPSQGQCRQPEGDDRCPWSGKLRLGWCPKHYERFRKWGDPTVERPIGRPHAQKRLCSVLDEDGPCQDLAEVRGRCRKHDRRWRTTGDPERSHRGEHGEFRGVHREQCGVLGCYEPARCRGFCKRHYTHVVQIGDPLGGKHHIKRDDQTHALIREYLRNAVTAFQIQEYGPARDWATQAIRTAGGKLTRSERELIQNGLLISYKWNDGNLEVVSLNMRGHLMRPLIQFMLDSGESPREVARKLGTTLKRVRRAAQAKRDLV